MADKLKGSDEQDAHDLEVPAVPIYIGETIDPLALIEELRADSEGPAASAESSKAALQAEGIVKAIGEDFERRGVSTDGRKPQ